MSTASRFAVVLGTRPEIIKNWAIVDACRVAGVPHRVLYTGQHASWGMNGAHFEELGYAADAAMPGPYSLGRAIEWVSERLRDDAIDVVLVNGDTAASLVGALAAMYSDRRVVHVEAGLRSFDPFMYEERNRIVVDAVSDLLLTYTEREAAYLRGQRELRGHVLTVGNTTVDLVHRFADRLAAPRSDRWLFVTMHRKEFADDAARMRSVFGVLREFAGSTAVVFPMHPRTADAMRRHGIARAELGAVEVVEPMGTFEALAHVRHAELVLTDSGCVQEEACILGTPCVTIRDNTERVATVEAGANVLSGFEPDALRACVARQRQRGRNAWPDLYGSPGVGARIVAALRDRYS